MWSAWIRSSSGVSGAACSGLTSLTIVSNWNLMGQAKSTL
ncbi:MAG: hypothetical protein JSS66_17625 [Armatimonadetes bacterium]|nr:hypothetical protein [Armatimonadota bacterium]